MTRISSTRRTLAALLLLAACLSAVVAQEATSVDADGNTIIYSVAVDEQGDPTDTIFLETIAATALAPVDPNTALPSTTTTSAAAEEISTVTDPGVDASAVPPGVLPEPTSNPVISRPQDVAPDGESTSLSTRPITYQVYLTENGVQIGTWATYTPKTPVPTTTIPPNSGTIVNIATYMPPPPPSSSVTGTAALGVKVFSASNGQVAAMAMLLSMLMGAIAVW